MSIQIEEYRDSQGGYATRHLKQWRADLCGIDLFDLHLVWGHERADLARAAAAAALELVGGEGGPWTCSFLDWRTHKGNGGVPTPRQAYLRLWKAYDIFKAHPTSVQAYRTSEDVLVTREDKASYVGIVQVGLGDLEECLVEETSAVRECAFLGRNDKLAVFLSRREDALSAAVAQQLGELLADEDMDGMVRCLIERGDIPIRFGRWGHEAEFSILWAPGTLDEPGR